MAFDSPTIGRSVNVACASHGIDLIVFSKYRTRVISLAFRHEVFFNNHRCSRSCRRPDQCGIILTSWSLNAIVFDFIQSWQATTLCSAKRFGVWPWFSDAPFCPNIAFKPDAAMAFDSPTICRSINVARTSHGIDLVILGNFCTCVISLAFRYEVSISICVSTCDTTSTTYIYVSLTIACTRGYSRPITHVALVEHCCWATNAVTRRSVLSYPATKINVWRAATVIFSTEVTPIHCKLSDILRKIIPVCWIPHPISIVWISGSSRKHYAVAIRVITSITHVSKMSKFMENCSNSAAKITCIIVDVHGQEEDNRANMNPSVIHGWVCPNPSWRSCNWPIIVQNILSVINSIYLRWIFCVWGSIK